MLITVCTLQTRVHFLTSYCHMLRSCTFGSNCKQQEVNTPIYWFFVVYLGLKFKKKKICAYLWDFSFLLRWDLCISCSTRMLSGVSLCCLYCSADLIQRRVSSKPVWRTKDRKCWRWHFSEHRWVCSSVCAQKIRFSSWQTCLLPT